MEALYNESTPEDIQRRSIEFFRLTNSPNSSPSDEFIFKFAKCLIGSRNRFEIDRGIHLLRQLEERETNKQAKVKHLALLAAGHIKVKKFQTALRYSEAILSEKPRDLDASVLKRLAQSEIEAAESEQEKGDQERFKLLSIILVSVTFGLTLGVSLQRK